jgi:ubiquinone/menaquinone biosynthesis C-methylase UbiE
MANVFDEMGMYWAEIADQDQTERQIQFLKHHLKPKDAILDLACGTGRHSIPLSQQGYEMVGLDVSARLLKIAKKRSSQLQVVRGDMRFLPFKPQTFAAAVSMDTSFGYLPSLSDDEISIAEVRRVLFKQGVFVIDVFNRKELAHKYAENTQPSKLKEYPSFFLQQKRKTNQNGNWLCDLWTIRDKVSERVAVFEHAVRLYAKDELEGLLAKAGFSVNQVFGNYEGDSFSADSPRLILEAQAE